MSETTEITIRKAINGGYIIFDGEFGMQSNRGMLASTYAFTTLPEALAYVSDKIWPDPKENGVLALGSGARLWR